MKTIALMMFALVGFSHAAKAEEVVCRSNLNVTLRIELTGSRVKMAFSHPAYGTLVMRNPGLYRDGSFYFRDDINVVRAAIPQGIFQGERGGFNYWKPKTKGGRGGIPVRFFCNQ